MAKKHRSGNREPRKPKTPKAAQPQAGNLTDLIKSRAANPGAKPG